ncbi:hypothetical protein HMPREF3226_01467, partial [Prevotella corporis]
MRHFAKISQKQSFRQLIGQLSHGERSPMALRKVTHYCQSRKLLSFPEFTCQI